MFLYIRNDQKVIDKDIHDSFSEEKKTRRQISMIRNKVFLPYKMVICETGIDMYKSTTKITTNIFHHVMILRSLTEP